MKKIYLILFFLEVTYLFGEVIYLKDGSIVKGKVARQTLTRIEVILPDNKIQVIEKQQIKKIQYISEEEFNKQEEMRKKMLKIQEEKRKREEELRKLEEEKKKQEEEKERLEEEKKRLEEQKKIEELRKIEEEQKKKEEELRKLEEEKRKQEEEKNKIEKLEKLSMEELSSNYKIQTILGLGTGNENTAIKKYFDYYNFYTSLLQSQTPLYIQNHQIQMKSSSFWNWGGIFRLGISILYKDWEYGILSEFYAQKPEPKFLSVINKNLIINKPYFDLTSELRYNFLNYQNQLLHSYIKIGTEKYFSFFWNYIFPYIELGYLKRNFRYDSKLSSTKTVSSNENSIANIFITELILKNELIQNAFKVGIPFRFLMIFDSEFLFNFELYFSGKTKIIQDSNENNILPDQIANILKVRSQLDGDFFGNSIKFTWQNKFFSSPNWNQIAYLNIYKTEWKAMVNKVKIIDILYNQGIHIFYANEIFLMPYSLLYKNSESYKGIKETQLFMEFGLKIQYNL